MSAINAVRNIIGVVFLILAAIPFSIAAVLITPSVRKKITQQVREKLTPTEVAYPTARVEPRGENERHN